MLQRHTQFIRERQYVMNVSPATIQWYTHAFKWLDLCANPEEPTQAELTAMICRMREKGLKATGANAALRAIAAYLRWSGSPHTVKQMKEPHVMMPTFTANEVKLLVTWKPKGFYDKRLHLLVLIMLDTGCRISEALGIRVPDIDLNDLLITLSGKGDKQRRVPISFELRRHIFRFVTEFSKQPGDLLLTSRFGTTLGRNVALRNVKHLCVRLGFKPPARTLHAFRHTFGGNYVRQGGSVFHLQKCLGHSSLEMSRRYANLQTEDLSAIHQKMSLLAA
jgi:integrase/recombinase XerD